VIDVIIFFGSALLGILGVYLSLRAFAYVAFSLLWKLDDLRQGRALKLASDDHWTGKTDLDRCEELANWNCKPFQGLPASVMLESQAHNDDTAATTRNDAT
jgi:hypothetical protein